MTSMQKLDLPARYELRSLLGRGGMGAVHEVYDHERGAVLALKAFMPEVEDASARFLFQQEYWAMATLAHPQLVAAYDYATTPDGVPYFTMELVEGTDLSEGLPLDEAAVRGFLPGLASALAFLHGRGYLHADLKPENIRLTDDGGVKLMDLGLLQRSGAAAGAIRGTLPYMAPEAVRQGVVDARTDLYSLGCVLYHALTGRPPFSSEQPLDVLRAHLEAQPAAPRGLAPALSAEMNAAVLKLLAKEPGDRPASANALLSLLGLAPVADEAAGLLGSPTIGREALDEELTRNLGEPTATTWWIHGGPGAGKTRLAAELSARAQLAGVPVVGVQGRGLDAPPYMALQPWLHALTATPGPELDRVAPRLARLVPVPGVTPAPALDGAQERARLQAAVVELAEARWAGPRLWLVDDADLLDAESRALLMALARAGAAQRWVFLATASAGEPLPDAARRELPVLEEHQVLALGSQLLGQALPEGLGAALAVQAEGRPGAAEAALQAWIEDGALLRGPDGWQLSPRADLSTPLARADERTLARLDADARWLLAVAARLGAAGELAWLAAAAALPDERLFPALTALGDARLLAHEGAYFTFARPGHMAGVAAACPEGGAPEVHDRAAAWLQERLPAHQEDWPLERAIALARHRLAGSSPLAGVPLALSAARRCLALYAMDNAIALATPALALPGLDAADRLELTRVLAFVLRYQSKPDEALALYDQTLLPAMRAARHPALAEQLISYGLLLQIKGRYAEAEEAFRPALEQAEADGDAVQTARAHMYYGRLAFFAGKPDLAREQLAAAIATARAAGPAGSVWLALALGFGGYLVATTTSERADEGLAMIAEALDLNAAMGNEIALQEALNSRGAILTTLSRFAEARDTYLDYLASCQRTGNRNDEVFAHLGLGSTLLILGEVRAAAQEVELGLEQARTAGRKFPESYALGLRGLLRLRQGVPDAALVDLADGLALAREIKNRYVEMLVLEFQAEAWLLLGVWEKAEVALGEARALAGDEVRAEQQRLGLLLRAIAADPADAAAFAAEVATQDGAGAMAFRLRAAGLRALQQGRMAEAVRSWEDARVQAGEASLSGLVAELDVLLGERALAEQRLDDAARHFGAGLERALGQEDLLVALPCQAGLGAASRADAALGRAARRRASELLAALDEPTRRAFLAVPGRAQLAPIAERLVPLDRLAYLTELIGAVSRQDEDLPEVMAKALSAVVELAAADRGYLVLYEGFKEAERVSIAYDGDEDDGYSTGLAHQVLWSGQPIFVEDASRHATLAMQQSVQALSLRSVLGLPLLDGHEVIGVMLADSKSINAAWTAADMALAEALAQAVSLAIVRARARKRDAAQLSHQAFVNGLARRLVGLKTIEEVATAAIEASLSLTRAERGFVLLGPADDLRCVASNVTEGTTDVSQSVCRWVVTHGEPQYVVDVDSEEALRAARSVMALRLRTIFGVPILHEGHCHGTLYLDSQRMLEGPEATLSMLSEVGALVGLFLSRS